MAGNTKVQSYKRTTSSGKVVDVQSYRQDRDLASPALDMPGRPGVAGRPGQYGRGRQFPGIHNEPATPPEENSPEARVQAATAAIESVQKNLDQLREHVAKLAEGSAPAGPTNEPSKMGPVQRKRAEPSPETMKPVPARQGGEESQFEGANAKPLPQEPMSDSDYEEHQKEIQYKVDEAVKAGLETYKQHTVDEHNEVWTKERAALHDKMLSEIIDAHAHVPRDRKAVMAGGLGGAGKTTVLTEHAGIPEEDYITLNPDDLKEEMVKRGLGPEIEGLSPMEASMLLHEESSYLSKMLALRAYEQGMNVKWDITMSGKGSTVKKLDEMEALGYETEAVFVDIPVEESVSRALARHRRGMEKHRNGEGLGGRYVPPAIIRHSADEEFSSGNRRTMEDLKDRFTGWRVYDNSVYGRDPMLLSQGGTLRSQEASRREAQQEEFTQTTETANEVATAALSQAIANLRGLTSVNS